MITATKSSNDMADLSYKSTKTDYSSKNTSELYNRMDDKKTNSKNEDFKQVLSSKTNSKEQDTQKVDEVNKNVVSNDNNTQTKEATDAEKLDELKQKLEELEEKSKDGKPVSEDELKEILSELLNLLVKIDNKDGNLKSDGKMNPEILEVMLKKLSEPKSINNNIDTNLNSVMKEMTELLKNDSIKDSLDADSLKTMKEILGNLSSNLLDDNSESTKEIKNNLKNLLSEVSKLADNKQNQNGKVLNLEDMLNKNYSQDNGEDSTENKNNDTTPSKDSKAVSSKEDKFLNSLIDDNKDDSLNKINLFASRSAAIQNQGVNTVKGLTVNKATFSEDLIKDVKFMNINSLKELTVKVNPGNLGEITIKLIQEDGLMKANLKANSKETTVLLSQNLADIKKQLGEQNIKISDVNIELYQDDTTYFSEKGFERNLAGEQNQQNKSSQSKASNGPIISNDSLDENSAQENSNINMFA